MKTRQKEALLKICEQAIKNKVLPKEQKVELNPLLKGTGMTAESFVVCMFFNYKDGMTAEELCEKIEEDLI